MNAIGTHGRNGRVVRLFRSTPAEATGPGVASSAATPYWLLWSTGIIAFVLCVGAFILWGVHGASTLFDMIVAFCT